MISSHHFDHYQPVYNHQTFWIITIHHRQYYNTVLVATANQPLCRNHYQPLLITHETWSSINQPFMHYHLHHHWTIVNRPHYYSAPLQTINRPWTKHSSTIIAPWTNHCCTPPWAAWPWWFVGELRLPSCPGLGWSLHGLLRQHRSTRRCQGADCALAPEVPGYARVMDPMLKLMDRHIQSGSHKSLLRSVQILNPGCQSMIPKSQYNTMTPSNDLWSMHSNHPPPSLPWFASQLSSPLRECACSLPWWSNMAVGYRPCGCWWLGGSPRASGYSREPRSYREFPNQMVVLVRNGCSCDCDLGSGNHLDVISLPHVLHFVTRILMFGGYKWLTTHSQQE